MNPNSSGLIFESLEEDKRERDVGKLAVWSVSSAKPGNGVDLLVDGSSDTYWQSDGMQPHTITLHFQQYVAISKVAIQTNYRMDESYTPQRLSVSVGTRWSDMSCIRTEEVIEPQGWIVLPIASEEHPEKPVTGRILQITILVNHQNGRDTHVRQVRVFGSRGDQSTGSHAVSWMTTDATMYATCR
ncbi:Anaphase-promoting complex subunit 10 [Picochlorum sp. SENEW3]|nr:Anaphase-promoting complex subunit 10 [Picochlorum sp. SENEW3]